MTILLDESGDLGWKFTAPYNNGGSSRFLTIAYVIIPNNKKNLLHRQISKTYQKNKWNFSVEHKGARLTNAERLYFLTRVQAMINTNPDIQIGAITTRKDRVFEHIKRDSNLLYNYMTKLAIISKVKQCNGNIEFIRDERSIKVASGNSLIEYLQTTLWFDENSKAIIIDKPTKSHQDFCILFVDWICNCIWNKYEYSVNDYYDLITPYLKEEKLFF